MLDNKEKEFDIIRNNDDEIDDIPLDGTTMGFEY